MRTIAMTAAATFLLLVLAPGSPAALSEYEYKVGSAELALLMFDKSAEEEVEEWARVHRPELFAAAFAPPKEAGAEKEGEAKRGLASFGTGLAARAGLLLDYYLNQQAKLGWDLHLMTDKQFVLRRKRSTKD